MNYKEISDSLRKDIPSQEFNKMWEDIASFLKTEKGLVSVLEGMPYFDDEFIVENRFFIADIFELAESLTYVLYDDLFSIKEKDCIFNKEFEKIFFDGLDAETIKILRAVFDVEDIPLKICGYETLYYSFESIFQKFKILLDNENILWIEYLKRAGELQPYDKEVVTYLLDYALIIEDEKLIKEYQNRLESVTV